MDHLEPDLDLSRTFWIILNLFGSSWTMIHIYKKNVSKNMSSNFFGSFQKFNLIQKVNFDSNFSFDFIKKNAILKNVKVVNFEKSCQFVCIWYFAKLAQKKTCLHNDSNYALYIVSRTKCCSTFGFSRDEKMNEASKAKTLKGGEGLSQTLFLIQMSIGRRRTL